MPFFRTFLFSTVLLAVASVCPARDIHVAATGSDTSGAGTAASPYREIRKGLTVLAPGDTLLISAGAYKGFDAVRLGSANTVTTIRATEPGVTITPTTDRGSNNSHNIVAWLCTNVVFEGLTSNNAPIAGLRLVECNNVTVRGGTFANNGKWGIVTSHCYDLLLENNDCSGSVLEHGIYVANSGDRPVVRGNRIHGNANSGLRLSGDANQGGDGIISGALIENNIIYDNGSNGGGAMNMDGLQDSIVRNNLIYNNRATGIALFKGLSSAGSTGVQVLNNTIIVMSIGRYCLRITDVVGPLTVRNNILYNLNTAKGPFSWNTPSDANFTNSDYNLFGGGRYVSTDGEYSRITMDNWMASGHETHSVASATLAQLFVAPSTHDYRLTFGSPALDRGTSAANVTKDILGVSRPQGAGVDIGAYESTPKQANTAPVAAAQTVAVAENSTDNVITLIATDTGTGDLTYQIVSPPSAAQGTLGPVTDNQVTFSPTPGFVGSTSFTFQASDSEGAVSNVATVKVNVLGVNAAPSFVIGANRSHPAAFATAQSVAGWATAINDGDPEVAQVLTFIVTQTDGPATMFTKAPAVSSTGALTYQTSGAAGTATFAVVLKDNGGTLNGGVDTSAGQTFSITVAEDSTAPTVTITSPVASAKVAETASGKILVTGTAADNKLVAKVELQVNGGPFATATTTVAASGLTAAYTAEIAPIPGLNTVVVKSIDAKNNVSVLVTRSFTYVVLRPFAAALAPAAGGMVIYSPLLVEGKAQIGMKYTLTARTNAGYFWDKWTTVPTAVTGAAERASTLTVVMTEGLAATANFMPTPFSAGRYTGLAQATGDTAPSRENLGLFSGALTSTGRLTASVNFAGTAASFIATFDPRTGDASGRNGSATIAATLAYDLHLDLSGGTEKITGTIRKLAGQTVTDVCTVDADRATFSTTTNPVPPQFLKPGAPTSNGIYTVVFPAPPAPDGLTSRDCPQGDGVGTVTVTPAGTVILAGTLADGTAVTTSAPLSKTFAWPLAVIIKSSATVCGMTLGGMAQLDTGLPDSDVTATGLRWFRPAMASAAYYPNGWPSGIVANLIGAKFVTPVGSSALPGLSATNTSAGNAVLEISDGLLGSDISKNVNISAANIVSNVPATDASSKLAITATSGLVTGSFSHNAPMAVGRFGHEATLLGDGKVLVSGGVNLTAAVTTNEVYNPATGAWSSAAAMPVARSWHTATLLANGKVLVAAGSTGAAATTGLKTAMLYNPALNTWSATGSLATTRGMGHSATLLGNGKVLVVGGKGAIGGLPYANTAELYNPATGTWAAAGSTGGGRADHTATLLMSGKVLIAGGNDGGGVLNSAQIYDPTTGAWNATGSLTAARADFTATLLPDGRVLAAGGTNGGGPVNTAEVYDPNTGIWTATVAMPIAMAGHSAALLATGHVLVRGEGAAAFYDPVALTWRVSDALTLRDWGQRAVVLRTGKVLIIGGWDGAASLRGGELYEPGTDVWCTLNTLTRPMMKGVILQKGASKGGYGFFLSPVAAGSGTRGEGGGFTLTAK